MLIHMHGATIDTMENDSHVGSPDIDGNNPLHELLK